MERWFVVQYYYNNGNQKGIVKSFNQLTELELELFNNKELKQINDYEIQVEEFKNYEAALEFKMGM